MKSQKRILVDLVMLRNLNCGLGQVVYNFVKEIDRINNDEFDFTFLVPKGFNIDSLNLEHNFKFITTNVFRKFIPQINETFDLWHATYQNTKYLPNPKTPLLLTVHDLNAIFEKSGKDFSILRVIKRNIRKAQALSSISEYTRQTIIDNLKEAEGKDITVIKNGVEKSNAAPSKPSFLQEGKFLFTIGELKPKKNFHTLIKMAKLLPEYNLVIAGSHDRGHYYNKIMELVKTNNLENRVLIPGIVSEAEKEYLYANCEAFLFPSILEGFGLPVIEALLHKKPVFASNLTSIPEIGKHHIYYFESFNPERMQTTFLNGMKAYQDDINKADLAYAYAQTYTWEKNVSEYLDLYRKMTS